METYPTYTLHALFTIVCAPARAAALVVTPVITLAPPPTTTVMNANRV